MVEITQADRDAAAIIANHNSNWVYRIKAGKCDHEDIVQSVATHRINSTAALQAQLDMAVAALEDVVNPIGNLKRYAESQGAGGLNNSAYSISQDLGFVQSIARDALTAIQGKDKK